MSSHTNPQNDTGSYSEFLRDNDPDGRWRSSRAGSRVRDFQCSRGGISVIDPEVFREMYDKVYSEYYRLCTPLLLLNLAYFVALCLCLAFTKKNRELFFLVGVWIAGMILIPPRRPKPKSDMINSYKSFFLEAYDIQLDWSTSEGIYFRRPRLSAEEEALEEYNRDTRDLDLAPIFLKELIPGDISIDMGHDVASMQVGERSWNLLQATHTRMVQGTDWMEMTAHWSFLFVFPLWWYTIVHAFMGNRVCGILVGVCGILVVASGAFLQVAPDSVAYFGNKYLRYRACKETARLVTESLPEDKEGVDWIVEFHTSDLPGRGPKYSKRYVFTRNEEAVTTRNRDTGNPDSAPIFVFHWIPGDISIDMVGHDVASMPVGVGTWNLLRETHRRKMEGLCWKKITARRGFLFVFPLWVYATVVAWIWNHVCGVLVYSSGPFLAFATIKMADFGTRYLRHRACKETARLLTESLPDEKDGVDWVVEFHTSDLGARGPKYSERYVFSKPALPSTSP